jgi:glycosyltransferase involved in cell wall biosynthesis
MTPLHRLWRLLPPHLRREALFTLMAAIAPRPSAAAQGGLPITVAGYFRAVSGLGESARRVADMLEAAGAPKVHRADLTAALRQTAGGPLPEPPPAGPGTLIVAVNGPMLPWALRALGRRAVEGKRVIGYWAWELPKLAPDWERGYRFVHEIWAVSDFVAEALRRPGGPPVTTVPYHVPDPEPAPLSRADFGLPEDAFIALSVFDASSSVERKNPVAAIRAHRQAFGERADRVLVLKTYKTGMGGGAWQQVLAEAGGAFNIRILDREMSRQEVWSLMRLSDAFVSLHRSEGFGMSLAESMRLGRPVVATGWSGNMDFMDGESAMLVGCRLVPAQDERGTYSLPGAVWAEPDIGEAARGLIALAEDPARRAAIAKAGRQRVGQLTAPLCGQRALKAMGMTAG